MKFHSCLEQHRRRKTERYIKGRRYASQLHCIFSHHRRRRLLRREERAVDRLRIRPFRLFDSEEGRMSNSTKYLVAVVILLGFLCPALGSMEDSERSALGSDFPYGRGPVNIHDPSPYTDSELQLARLLMIPQRMCHPKRNSELINSLLGLPKNMNNAGK